MSLLTQASPGVFRHWRLKIKAYPSGVFANCWGMRDGGRRHCRWHHLGVCFKVIIKFLTELLECRGKSLAATGAAVGSTFSKDRWMLNLSPACILPSRSGTGYLTRPPLCVYIYTVVTSAGTMDCLGFRSRLGHAFIYRM